MKLMKSLIMILLCLCLQTGLVWGAGVEKLAGEYNRTTGTNWGFPGYKVTYTVSDSKVAEVIKRKDGQPAVHFIGPGDVYVHVTFYSQGQPVETEVHLFHITGENKGEEATDWSNFAGEILRLTNEERKKEGLPPLKADFNLSDAAAVRVEEASRVFDHTRPDGSGFETALQGIDYQQAGENLQAGAATPAEAVYQWMHSPGHRANILHRDYNALGVGYIYVPNSRYHHYWVQIFLKK